MKNLLAFPLVFQTAFLFAQCMLQEISMEDKIEASSIIAEGRVIASHSFKNEQQLINTYHEIELFKIFKGNPTGNILTIETEGGQLGNEMQVVSSALLLKENQSGIFFLNSNPKNVTGYEMYSGPQGFIAYDSHTNGATDPFNQYENMEAVHQRIVKSTGITPQVIKKHKMGAGNSREKGVQGAIVSISPLVTTAGTDSMITITGNGFGALRGSSTIIFDNASTSPPSVNPTNNQYVSWSDTKIEVIVPSRAGSGTVKIDNGSIMTSSDVLTILYAQLNAVLASNDEEFQAAHIDQNNDGGYTWRMHNDFDSNNDAKQTFIRAVTNWRNATCINWEVGPATSINQTSEDTRNVVRFDVLPAGVLAATRSYYRSCNGTDTWYVNELDITYSPDIDWNFGSGNPNFSEYDMESVTIHELGHAHQLGHVNDKDDIMFASITTNEVKRDLNFNNRRGGKFIQAQSTTTNSCGPSAMTNYPGCDPSVGQIDDKNSNSFLAIYPNPADDFIQLRWTNPNASLVKIEIIDFSGKKVLSLDKIGNNERIPTHGLSSGFYFVECWDSNNKMHLSKLLIKSKTSR